MKHLIFITFFSYSLFAMNKEDLRPFIQGDDVFCTIPLLPKEQQQEIALIVAKYGAAGNIQDILRKKIKEMHDSVISGLEEDPKIICNIEKQNYRSYKVSCDANYILILNLLCKLIPFPTMFELKPAEYSFSNKDKLISYDAKEKKLIIYELPFRMLYEVPCDNANSFLFNADDTMLAVINKSNKVQVYNGTNGIPLMVLENVRRYAKNACVLFNPNNTQIITRSPDFNKIFIWDTQNKERILHNANAAAFNGDGSCLAIANGKTTSLYDSKCVDKPLSEFLTFKANHLYFSSDNKRLLLEKIKPNQDTNKKVIFDLESKVEIYKDFTSLQKKINPNLDRIAIQGRIATPLPEKHKCLRGKVITLDGKTSYDLSQTKSKFLLFDPSGNYLITEAPPFLALNYILLRNARTGTVISHLPHNYEKGLPVFSDKGKKLITNTGNNLYVWQLNPLDPNKLCTMQKAALLLLEHKFRHGHVIQFDEIMKSNSASDNLISLNEEVENKALDRYNQKVCYGQTPVEFIKVVKTKSQAIEGATTELVATTQTNDVIRAQKVKTGPYAGLTTAARYIYKPSLIAPQVEPLDACKAKTLFFEIQKKLKQLKQL